MEAGNRVLVYHSPGSPLDHWIFATVLTPQANGALVQIDHPANIDHGQVKFVVTAKIRNAEALAALAVDARAKAAVTVDSTKKQELIRHAQMYEEQAAAL